MNELEKLEEGLKSLETEIIDIENHFLGLFALKDNKEGLADKLSLLDNAKLNGALAYSMNSLYFVYMKLNGIPLENHKINQENERLKDYFKKIQEILPSEKTDFPKVNINKMAIHRIITGNLERNNRETKEIAKEIKDWDIIENKNNLITKKKEKQKLLKGALLPSGKHLTWKEELEKMMK